jgi:hypothetical protein
VTDAGRARGRAALGACLRGVLCAAVLLAGCTRLGEGTRADSASAEASGASERGGREVVAVDRAGRDVAARAEPGAPAELALSGAVAGGRYATGAVPDGGVVEGRITDRQPGRAVARDRSVVPTHDLDVCRPFTETRVPSRDRGVGEAVVWLAGVRTGPADTTTLRPRLELDGCRLYPRVQRVRVGSTVQVASYDAMSSRLRFTADANPVQPLALVSFTDAGQVVPVEGLTRTPGIVRVRDDRHPWVLGVLAVAPHPWVAVTEPDGRFRFDAVPPGRYTLVVWQEALGTRTQPLRVEPGVTVRLTVDY